MVQNWDQIGDEELIVDSGAVSSEETGKTKTRHMEMRSACEISP